MGFISRNMGTVIYNTSNSTIKSIIRSEAITVSKLLLLNINKGMSHTQCNNEYTLTIIFSNCTYKMEQDPLLIYGKNVACKPFWQQVKRNSCLKYEPLYVLDTKLISSTKMEYCKNTFVYYSKNPLNRTSMGPDKMSGLEGIPVYRGFSYLPIHKW